MPDNLKTLFRSVAMVKPDSTLIAQVMLFSQGLESAHKLSSKVVELFRLCQTKIPSRRHYDFSLRALKTLLISAGSLKRKLLEEDSFDGRDVAATETDVLVQITCNNILPKLVADDLIIFPEILSEVFPGASVKQMEDEKLKGCVQDICTVKCYVPGEDWIQKILQLEQVLTMRHGVMLVGPSGAGKSSALEVLLGALEKKDGIKNEKYTIDPKAMDKRSLYGALDGTTMQWTDGVFTSLLRKILANQKGEAEKRHFIVFDGDVDPEWAENLNSVLDDNKLLTLPSGERLSIPDNLRILLEVDSLEQATPATVSRCGMVWFSANTVSMRMAANNLLMSLQKEDITNINAEIPQGQLSFLDSIKTSLVPNDEESTSLLTESLIFASGQNHIMKPTRERFLGSLRALLAKGIAKVIDYDENHPDFPMTGEHLNKFAKHWLMHSLLWSFSGSAPWSDRQAFSDMLLQNTGLVLPGPGSSISDYRVREDDGEHELWSESVPQIEIESHKVVSSDVVVTTTDTVRHSDVLEAWLSSRKPLILCGPPGKYLQNLSNSMVCCETLNFYLQKL